MKFANILFLLFFLLPACGSSVAPKDRLVIAIESSPTTFDPRAAVDAYAQKIGQLVFSGLVKLNDRFEYEPDAAERIEQPDERTYRFYLRSGVKFHDGSPLTADDVIYTFQSIIDGKVVCPFKAAFDNVAEIRKEGTNAVVFRLKEPNATFLLNLTKGIVSKKAAEMLGSEFGLRPVGTGPYRIVEAKTDSHYLFAANKDYFGSAPRLPYLEFQVLKDDNVRVLQVMKGTVDLLQNATPLVLVGMLGKRDGIVVESGPSVVFGYLGMNLQDKILSNVSVRRALAHGIDRDEIIRHKWGGFARKADSILAPENWAFSRDVVRYDHDPEKAKMLLDEAGFPDPDGGGPEMRFYLSYKTSTAKFRIDLANLIAEQLKKIGVGVRVTPYEFGTFMRDVKNGDFQLYSLSWVGVSDPDIYYTAFNSREFPPAGANRNRFSDRRVDDLTLEGRRTLDVKKRYEIYKDVQKIVSEELPYISLWYEDNVVVRRKDVEGYAMSPNASFKGVVGVYKE